MENHTKYQESIYFRVRRRVDPVGQPVHRLDADWAEKGFTITQETDYPREQRTRLTVNGRGRLRIKLRVPGWVEKGFRVRDQRRRAARRRPGRAAT